MRRRMRGVRIMTLGADRVGLGWRRELAAGILSNIDKIDLVEVIADDFFRAPRSERRALRTLAAQVPVALHGVTLGLASTVPVETRRLDQVARLCVEAKPTFCSDHLAFSPRRRTHIPPLPPPPPTHP